MSNTLYGYMSPFELELAREDAKLELEGSRLIYEYEMLEKEHELMLEEIELKSIVMEGCTSDDLYMMYEDENQSNEEKKEGIITKIWNWLKNIFNAIIGKTKETIRIIKVESKYTIKCNINKLNGILDDVKKLIDDVKSGKTEKLKASKEIQKYNNIKGIVDTDGNRVSINDDLYMKAIRDEGSIQGDELKSGLENLSNKCNDILGIIKTEAKTLSNTVANFLKNIVSKINTTVSTILNSIKGNDGDNGSDNGGSSNKNVNFDDIFNKIKGRFSDSDQNKIKAKKDEVVALVTNAVTDKAIEIADLVADKFGLQKKGEQVDQNSVHDIDDVYSSIFESLDIDTIDSTFEESYSESYDNDLNAFVNILDDLLQ